MEGQEDPFFFKRWFDESPEELVAFVFNGFDVGGEEPEETSDARDGRQHKKK